MAASGEIQRPPMGRIAWPPSLGLTAAPTVTTGSATSVTETGETLNGTVNPNGTGTKYYSEYGTSTSYGSNGRSERWLGAKVTWK